MEVRLEDYYKNSVRLTLLKDFKLKNIMAVPRLEKIVINVGIKEAVVDSKAVSEVQDVISKITGQSVVKTKARKSIAGFKIREGMIIGVKVTLRRKKMYHFLDKLINIVLPSVRDFHGIPTKFDGHGNYNLGIKDWMVFPEIDYDKVERICGLNVTIHTSTSSDEKASALLKNLGMPFQKIDY